MNSLMSMRSRARSSSNRKAASALVSSVLPTPVGPRNRNAADRAVGVLQAGSGAAHRIGDMQASAGLLPYHPAAQLVLHAQQLGPLALEHPLHRHAGPPAHHGCDLVGSHRLVHQRTRRLHGPGQTAIFFSRLRDRDPVHQLRGTRVVAIAPLRQRHLAAGLRPVAPSASAYRSAGPFPPATPRSAASERSCKPGQFVLQPSPDARGRPRPAPPA